MAYWICPWTTLELFPEIQNNVNNMHGNENMYINVECSLFTSRQFLIVSFILSMFWRIEASRSARLRSCFSSLFGRILRGFLIVFSGSPNETGSSPTISATFRKSLCTRNESRGFLQCDFPVFSFLTNWGATSASVSGFRYRRPSCLIGSFANMDWNRRWPEAEDMAVEWWPDLHSNFWFNFCCCEGSRESPHCLQ